MSVLRKERLQKINELEQILYTTTSETKKETCRTLINALNKFITKQQEEYKLSRKNKKLRKKHRRRYRK